jgi:ABC-type transport system involved in multi-copper enzyme maturation permease subunit
MKFPEIIYACRWLIRDTFRQAKASYVFWIMLAASATVILFCLSVSIEGGEPLRPDDDIEMRSPYGHMSLAFGAWRFQLFRDGQAQVHFLLLLLAEWVAGAGGTLLALVWTAGFVPEFLQPANATVLLSKPIPRWVLLMGKYLGVLAFAGFQVTFFIVGTWLALSLRTGFWVNNYLWGIPLLLLQFAAVYSVSVFLAICTRSTSACVIGSVAFWFLCWGMNYGRHCLLALESAVPPLHSVLLRLVEAGYWVLPKPADFGMVLHRVLDAGDCFSPLSELQKVQQSGSFYPELSLLTSLLFIIGTLVVSARQLAATDF